ncbi:hypothetical protein [Pseudooceanicola sp. 200-1SW]|uniref:hypothetical protein n=1 Tax=Pseudooceanicola sp. 200-1SW TaxID=3425949 RepID=UPI003D7FB94D
MTIRIAAFAPALVLALTALTATPGLADSDEGFSILPQPGAAAAPRGIEEYRLDNFSLRSGFGALSQENRVRREVGRADRPAGSPWRATWQGAYED